MPAKYQSEYMRNFKWSDRPIRFKQPTASLDLRTGVCELRRAGLASSTTGIHREPAIQIKQRSASPLDSVNLQQSEQRNHRSSSSGHHHHHRHASASSKQGISLSTSGSALPFSDPLYRPVPPLISSARSDDAPPAGKPTWKQPGNPASAVADDFILLGSQQKFAPNVAYRLRKPLNPHRFSQLPTQPPTAERIEQDTQTVQAPLPPQPQVVIASPPVARFYTADENVQVNDVELPDNALTPPPSPPDAPRREKSPETLAVQTEAIQTEAIQTEFDDHYAVRHRLGLASRVNAGRFTTEYGRQYNPTHSVSAPSFRKMKQQEPESPIMNNVEMFHRSRSRSPVGATVMPPSMFQTEYDRSFKPYQWQLHQLPVRRSLSAEGHEIMYEGPREPEKPHHHHHHKKEKEQELEVVAKMKAMKWPKRFLSEYMSNFRQPSAFKYESGTWKGVTQPHIGLAQSAPTAVVVGDPSWLAEVRELKSRAKEYQLRNKGTHFSSMHVGQLYSEKARLWDSANLEQNGDGGSRLAMLDTSIPRSAPSTMAVPQEVAEEYVQVDTLPTAEDLIRPAGLPTIRRGNVRESLEWAIQPSESSSAGSESECSSSVEQEQVRAAPPPPPPSQPQSQRVQHPPVVTSLEIPKTGRSEESSDTSRTSGSTESSSSSGVLPTAAGGRVRTSRLAELQRRGNGSPRRHHLDVTTPAVGGAILVSPPMPVGEKSKHHRKSRSGSRNRSIGDLVQTVPNTAAGASSGYSSGARSRTPPASGKPTVDTHLLVDRDRPLRFQYVPNPKDRLPDTNASGSRRAGNGTIEQLILERSNRENVPIISIAKDNKKSSKKPLSGTQPTSSSARPDIKASQRSAGVMAAIPESMSTTYKVKPSNKTSTNPGQKAAQKAPQEQRSPPSRASSATYSAASDILEKARARSSFWEKSATVKA